MAVFRRKGTPHYYADFIIKGRRIYRSTGKVSLREAKAVERALKEEVRRQIEGNIYKGQPARSVANELTVDEAFGRYWLEHGSQLRWAHEVESYLMRMHPILGDIKVIELSTPRVAHMVEALKERKIGSVALNRALSILRSVMNIASKRWGCATHIIDWRVLRGKEPKERVRWLTREEAANLLACLPPHIGLIVEWSLYTGLRKRETLSLKWRDVDLMAGHIDVWVKGGIQRRLQLSEPAKDVLARCPKNGSVVFDGSNLRKHFERGLKLAKIENFRFHDLRHTYATWLRQGGAALEIVQRSLGHSSISVTQKYAHVHDPEVVAAANTIAPLTTSNVVRLLARRAPAKFTYFITDGESVKIGRSNDPQRRLNALQVGHPRRLWLVGTVPIARLREDEAHSMFAMGHMRGEWFKASDRIIEQIATLCKASGPVTDGKIAGV